MGSKQYVQESKHILKIPCMLRKFSEFDFLAHQVTVITSKCLSSSVITWGIIVQQNAVESQVNK